MSRLACRTVARGAWVVGVSITPQLSYALHRQTSRIRVSLKTRRGTSARPVARGGGGAAQCALHCTALHCARTHAHVSRLSVQPPRWCENQCSPELQPWPRATSASAPTTPTPHASPSLNAMSRVCVKGLPKHATEAEVRAHFAGLGDVTDVKIARTP